MANKSEIIPKGTKGDCYKNVQDYLLDNNLPQARIVHGEVTSMGKTVNHAWIEDGSKVIDPTTGVVTTKVKFYQMLHPKKDASYTFDEALKLRFKTKNFGPWTDVEVYKVLGKH